MPLPPYHLNVTLTGLILMKTDNQGQLAGHIIGTGGHRALLSFRAVDVRKPGGLKTIGNIGVDAEGEEIIGLEVNSNVEFDFDPPRGSKPISSVGRPGYVDLTGIASASDFRLSQLDDDAMSKCSKLVVPSGATVRSGPYSVDPATGRPLLWGFFPRDVDPSGDDGKYLSSKIVCSRSIPVENHILVKVGNVRFTLSPPGGGDVALSLSNVPPQIDYSRKPSTEHVRHYAMVYGTKEEDVFWPKQLTGKSEKPGGICPPANADA